tara:strand:+ start:1768 stop:2022 length:255 start_codon:yes stop_codon:yes gene_type:complete
MSANKIVLTQEEIQSLVSLQQKQNEFIIQLGQIEYQVNSLDKQKKEIKNNINQFEQDQLMLSKNLKEKYGEGTINLENGEFVKA